MPCPDTHGPTPILIFGEWRVFSDLSVRHNGEEILTREGGVTRQIDGSLVLTAARIREACVELCCIVEGESSSDIASTRERKLQDENQALRDQIELLEKDVEELKNLLHMETRC